MMLRFDFKKCIKSKDLAWNRPTWRNKINVVNSNIIESKL